MPVCLFLLVSWFPFIFYFLQKLQDEVSSSSLFLSRMYKSRRYLDKRHNLMPTVMFLPMVSILSHHAYLNERWHDKIGKVHWLFKQQVHRLLLIFLLWTIEHRATWRISVGPEAGGEFLGPLASYSDLYDPPLDYSTTFPWSGSIFWIR